MPPKGRDRRPAHSGLSSIDPLGAMILFVCIIIVAAYILPDVHIQKIFVGVSAFYAVSALVIGIACPGRGKISTS